MKNTRPYLDVRVLVNGCIVILKNGHVEDGRDVKTNKRWGCMGVGMGVSRIIAGLEKDYEAKVRICIDALVTYPFYSRVLCDFCTARLDKRHSKRTDCPVNIARQLKAEWEKKP